jgi:cytochrome c556
MQKRSLGLVVLAAGLAAATVARSADDPAKARHEAMEQVGDAMKGLGKIARGQAPFDATFVASSATTIKEKLEQASKLFPPGSDTGETKARPEVWSDRAGFDKVMTDAQAAAAALQLVKEEAAFRPALGALGQNCKACHDKYRMPEQH